MPSARDARAAARTARPDAPFGAPSPDEVFEILIPEGAATGKIPAGDQYIGKLLTLVKSKAKSSGNEMWVFTFTISEGEYAGMDFPIYAALTPNALWKLADTLAALGVKFVAGEPLNFKLKDVLGIGVRMSIKDDKNQDGTRDISKLAAVLPHPKGAGFKDGKAAGFVVPTKPDDDEEEASVRRGRKPVREDAYEDEEEDERPRRPRAREAEEENDEDDEPVVRKGRKAAPADDDGEWEEPPASAPRGKRRAEPEPEDDDEEPAPAPRRGGRVAAPPAGRRGRL